LSKQVKLSNILLNGFVSFISLKMSDEFEYFSESFTSTESEDFPDEFDQPVTPRPFSPEKTPVIFDQVISNDNDNKIDLANSTNYEVSRSNQVDNNTNQYTSSDIALPNSQTQERLSSKEPPLPPYWFVTPSPLCNTGFSILKERSHSISEGLKKHKSWPRKSKSLLIIKKNKEKLGSDDKRKQVISSDDNYILSKSSDRECVSVIHTQSTFKHSRRKTKKSPKGSNLSQPTQQTTTTQSKAKPKKSMSSPQRHSVKIKESNKQAKQKPKKKFLSISDLPNEILAQILSFLTVKDLVSMSLVSRQFYELTSIGDIWKNIVVRNFGSRQASKSLERDYRFESI